MNPPADTVTHIGQADGQDHALPPEQQQQLMAILEDYVDQLGRGVAPDESEIVAANPELGEKLRAYFDSLSLLNEAAGGCQHEPDTVSDGREDSPQSIGNYTIIREIGRGGMGIVYEAKEISLDRRVALKVLPFAAVLEPKQTTRFRHEAQAAAQLHHGNIVPVYSVGCERGVHYYAMQFIEGQSLDVAIAELRRQYAAPLSDIGRRHPASTVALSQCNDGRSAAEACNRTCSWKGLPTAGSHKTTRYIRSVAALGIQVAEALSARTRLRSHPSRHQALEPAVGPCGKSVAHRFRSGPYSIRNRRSR